MRRQLVRAVDSRNVLRSLFVVATVGLAVQTVPRTTPVLLVEVKAVGPGGGFEGCPAVDASSMTPTEFWELMWRDPRPRRLTSPSFPRLTTAEFLARFAEEGEDGWSFPNASGVSLAKPSEESSRDSYILTGFEHCPDLIREIHGAIALPDIVSKVRSRPILSLGARGSGESNILHHFHVIATMVLLDGQKIWALRRPDDPMCSDEGTAGCADPLDVCGLPEAERPPCVQNAGEILVLPDGWYHGTCNSADWTLGIGGQGIVSDYVDLGEKLLRRVAATSNQVSTRFLTAVRTPRSHTCAAAREDPVSIEPSTHARMSTPASNGGTDSFVLHCS